MADLDCIGWYEIGEVVEINGTTWICKDNKATHAEDELVRFDKSMDARSARIASGFCQ